MQSSVFKLSLSICKSATLVIYSMFRQQPGEEAGFIISGDERKQHRGSERVDDGGRI